MIQIQNLAIGYRKGSRVHTVISGLSLSAGKGELVTLIGRNGCGKSTLLRTIAGIQSPLKGSVMLMGISVRSFSPKERALQLSFVPAEPAIADMMRVREFVMLGRYPHTAWMERPGAKDLASVKDSLALTGMLSFENSFFAEMSDGEKQKVNIARALAQDTPVIILDEPSAFLDIQARHEIMDLLQTLARERNKTIILSAHDLGLVITRSDKAWVFSDDGVSEGAPEDLVLNGTIERTFASGSSIFDQASGEFRPVMKFLRKVSLTCGNPIWHEWTKRALQRAGYQVIDPGNEICNIKIDESGNLPAYLINDDVVRYITIYQLLRKLSKIYP